MVIPVIPCKTTKFDGKVGFPVNHGHTFGVYIALAPQHTQSIGRGSREPPGRWLASSVAGEVQWTSPPQDAHDNVSNPPVHI